MGDPTRLTMTKAFSIDFILMYYYFIMWLTDSFISYNFFFFSSRVQSYDSVFLVGGETRKTAATEGKGGDEEVKFLAPATGVEEEEEEVQEGGGEVEPWTLVHLQSKCHKLTNPSYSISLEFYDFNCNPYPWLHHSVFLCDCTLLYPCHTPPPFDLNPQTNTSFIFR